MGLSLRYFIFDDKSGRLQKITNSKFEKIFKGDKTVSLKEYAQKTIKYITVIIQNENRKPVAIIHKQYGILKLDSNGQVDPAFQNELRRDAMSFMSFLLPLDNKPENVIDSSAEFARKKFHDKYTWEPSFELVQKIEELIFS